MKILFINQAFYPDLAATAQVLTDAALRLTEEGHEVVVLTGRRGYLPPHLLYPAQEEYRGVKIIRVSPFMFGRGSKIKRILDAFVLNLAFTAKLFQMQKFDRVVAMTTPPLVAWTALIFSKLRGIKLTYWMMDINPDQAIRAGWIKQNSLEAKFLGWILKYVLRHSDQIIVLDRFMKDLILEKGASLEKVRVIAPCLHTSDLKALPHSANPFRQRHQLDGKFTVMYSGNHSICHPLNTLLRTALCLKDDPSIVFMFIGEGERVKEVAQFKEKHSLSNLVLLPHQEASELKYSLSAADLHVVVMGEPFVGIVHPSKIYGILAMGRPFVLIGPKESSVGELIKSKQIGCQVDHGDVNALVRVIYETKNLSANGKNDILEENLHLRKSFESQKLMDVLVS